jgi:hypothetical protein
MNPGPRPQTLETWLRRMVRQDAAKLRCILEDDTEKLVKVELKGQRPRIAALMRTIASFAASKLEALDEAGNVLDVWELEGDKDAPGYLKEESDTGDERLLKTFAHLLSDAYKHAQKQLVEVVSIQSQSFAEERKHLAVAVQTSDRIMRRVRVAGASDITDKEPAEDNFLASLLGPLLQNEMRKAAGGAALEHETEGSEAKPNGAAKEPS